MKKLLIFLPLLVLTIFGNAQVTKLNNSTVSIDASGNVTNGTTASGVTLDVNRGVVLNGTASVWEDGQVPALGIRLQGSTDPALTSGFAGNSDFYLYYFQGGGSTNDLCYFTLQFSHSIKANDSLMAHVHWSPTTNVNVGSDTVVWELQYSYADLNGLFPSVTKDTVKCYPGANRRWYHHINTFKPITSKTISSIIVCRLRRINSSASDTYPDNAAFLGFDIHFKKDTEGSQQERIK